MKNLSKFKKFVLTQQEIKQVKGGNVDSFPCSETNPLPGDYQGGPTCTCCQ